MGGSVLTKTLKFSTHMGPPLHSFSLSVTYLLSVSSVPGSWARHRGKRSHRSYHGGAHHFLESRRPPRRARMRELSDRGSNSLCCQGDAGFTGSQQFRVGKDPRPDRVL